MTLYAFNNKTPDIAKDTFIAPTAEIIGDVVIGSKSSVWFSSVVRGDLEKITIGMRTNVQDLCVCHADPGCRLSIGNNVTIGHRCIIHGCTIGNHCLIGMGAVVMNHAVIGEGSIVAAGAVILEGTHVPPFSLVTGIPGKIRKTRRSRDDIRSAAKAASDDYVKNAELYQKGAVFFPVD